MKEDFRIIFVYRKMSGKNWLLVCPQCDEVGLFTHDEGTAIGRLHKKMHDAGWVGTVAINGK